MDRFTVSPAPQRKVKALQFGVLDAEFLVGAAPTLLPMLRGVLLQASHCSDMHVCKVVLLAEDASPRSTVGARDPCQHHPSLAGRPGSLATGLHCTAPHACQP